MNRDSNRARLESRRLHSVEKGGLENEVPQSSSVIYVTLRVDTPFTTISMRASTSACSLL